MLAALPLPLRQRAALASAWAARPGPARLIRTAAAAAAVSVTATSSLVMMTPTTAAPALAAQLAAPQARSFSGTPAVGALFTRKNGTLTHFCTASVVHSTRGNLLITAAHCMQGRSLKPAGVVTFAPGYHNGHFPHGRWIVRASYTDSRWKASRDPNDDVAFLIAGRRGVRIEKYTGAETLATGTSLPREVKVIGYPDTAELPVSCWAKARAFTRPHLRQEVFDCAGYTDGTSGGPFLYRVSKTTGTGRVMGVIGGYQQGGNTPAISYSARFLANIAALYKKATS
ncbi:MAG TPA: trypsin-like serine protease [Streptosporangiaceae bacterium]|nr:trypsin-like serine protease [Streptosporangiaceae bacterium]